MNIEINFTLRVRQRRRSPRSTMPISRPVYADVMSNLNARAPEAGGLLIGPRDNRIVTHFVLDESGSGTSHSFTLGHEWLNSQMEKFAAAALDIKGFVHSHPEGATSPSEGDRRYLARVFDNPRNRTAELYFPIVCAGILIPYIVRPELLYSLRWAMKGRLRLI